MDDKATNLHEIQTSCAISFLHARGLGTGLTSHPFPIPASCIYVATCCIPGTFHVPAKLRSCWYDGLTTNVLNIYTHLHSAMKGLL